MMRSPAFQDDAARPPGVEALALGPMIETAIGTLVDALGMT